ncbi:MAG: hypothetical protein JWQ75_3203 [Pseudarthrobacter sp.]|nr:hypothetical protein [Pseudarthrobacter sp.]
MSAAMTRPDVGTLLTNLEELDALPPFSVVLADPEGRGQYERDRRLAIQKRPGDDSASGDWWYPAWDSDIWNALATTEIVHRFHLGPFQLLWLPPAQPAVEAAA